MDKSFFRRQGSKQQPNNGMTAGLQIFRAILKWLTDLFQFTEEEQMNAGIYFGKQRDD